MSDLTPLPTEFSERLAQIFPAEQLEPLLQTFAVEKPTTFRINPLKTTVGETQAELEATGFELTPVSWYEGAFILHNEQRRALTESAAFYDGRIYIQNLSSMLAPQLLAPQPGEEVLDLAAAPGGKTLQLAAMMQNEGYLAAVEPIKNRFFRLRGNLEQQGATMVKTYMMDGRAAGRRWPQVFDRVMLDAPCSSEARITQLNPDSWTHWSTRKIKETSRKQKKLLQAAIYALKPGGTIVYCTCAFSPEENEQIVDYQLQKFGDVIEILPIELPLDNVQAGLTKWGKKELDPAVARCVRILPTAVMDGFFLCHLRKKSSR